MEKITIKNLTTCDVGLRVPEIRLNRIIKKNDSIKMNKELFEEALTYPGIQPMIDQKIIGVVEEEARINLGLQWDNDEVNDSDLANANEIKKILSEGTPFAIKKLCTNASDNRKSDIAQIAFTLNTLSIDKIDLLTEYTGIDILAGIKATKELAD